MQSHRCDFAWRELLRDLAWTLAPVALFAIAMHAGVLTSLWPRPRPAFDTERTVLLHQADACRKAESAEVLLLGDSSCLMDVSARRLSERLGRPVLNLGTFSFLDLNAHALFLKEYVQHHPTPPRAVVLLLHPEALRRLSSDGFYLGALTNYWARREHYVGQTPSDRASRWMGVEIFRERFLGRLPVPLPGAYGQRYGFSRDLEMFMNLERGSLIDPEQVSFTGNAEYRLAATLEKASRAFRAAVPSPTKLIVGITPAPAEFAGPRYPARQAQFLRAWGTMLSADVLLTRLPATLPDRAFARTTHLRGSEIPAYTDALATELERAVP